MAPSRQDNRHSRQVQRQVNGEVNGDINHHKSAVVQHLLSYPVISDTIETVQANAYAQRSLKVGDSMYRIFAAPVLPLLQKPYSYVHPYVEKADTLGVQTLQRVDERFPATKKSTSEIYHDTRELAFMPVTKATKGRDYVLDVYASECKKMEQEGLVAQGKAAIITAFIVSNDILAWLSGFVSKPRSEPSAARPSKEKVNQ